MVLEGVEVLGWVEQRGTFAPQLLGNFGEWFGDSRSNARRFGA